MLRMVDLLSPSLPDVSQELHKPYVRCSGRAPGGGGEREKRKGINKGSKWA